MGTVSIPLTKGKTALIDEQDYERVSKYRWRVVRETRRHHPDAFYVFRRQRIGNRKTRVVWLHRFILNAPPGIPVDHEDGDGLNNTRANLRYTNHSLNQANRRLRIPTASSRFRGVTLHRQTGKWQAAIKVNQKNKYLGLFSNEEDAARAYDVAANKAFGEFAVLNFPDELEAA